MAFASLADELGLDGPMSPGGHEIDLAGGSLASELDYEYEAELGGGLGLADELERAMDEEISEYEEGGPRGLDLELGDAGMANGYMDTTTNEQANGHYDHTNGDAVALDEPPDTRPTVPRLATPSRRGRVPSARIVSSTRAEPPEDPLEALASAQAAGGRVLTLLRDLHRESLDERLQAHLQRLSEADRHRDEQAREAAALVRDLGALDPNAEYDLSWFEFSHVANGHLEDVDEESTGSPHSPLARFHPSPDSPTANLSPTSPTTRFSNGLVHGDTSPLGAGMATLGAATASLVTSLSSLLETTNLALQSSQNATRTLRGRRRAVADALAADAAEDTAIAAVHEWEDVCERGARPDVREEMDAVMGQFAARLEEAERRWRAVRAG